MNNIFKVSIIITLFCSCRQTSDSWCVLEIKGVQQKGQNIRINDMLFVSPSVGYLIGNRTDARWEGDNLVGEDSALFFKTSDGGVEWHSSIISKGSFEKIFSNGKDIFILKRQEEDSKGKYMSSIYVLDKKTENLIPVSSFAGFIRDFAWYDSLGIVTSDKELKEYKFYLTQDDGKSWKKLNTSGEIYNPLFKKGIVIYLCSNDQNSALRNKLIVFDYLNDKITTTELPLGFGGELLYEYKNELWILGRSDDTIVLLKRTASNHFEIVKEFESNKKLFPKKIHVVNQEIFILIGETNELHVINKVLRSVDGGVSWKEESLAYPLYSDPISFFDVDSTFLTWIYSGSYSIQVPCDKKIFSVK